MFRRAVPFGPGSLQVFVSRRDPIDAYTTVADLAAALELQPETVREELSGRLVQLPELTAWLSNRQQNDANDTDSPLSASFYFAPSASAVWKSLVKSRVPSAAAWSMIKDTIRRAAAREEMEDHRRDGMGPNKRPRDDADGNSEDMNIDSSSMEASMERTGRFQIGLLIGFIIRLVKRQLQRDDEL